MEIGWYKIIRHFLLALSLLKAWNQPTATLTDERKELRAAWKQLGAAWKELRAERKELRAMRNIPFA